MKKHLVVLALILSAALFLPGAHAREGGLAGWQGEFVSRTSIGDSPQLQAFYEKTATEARKLGKSCTKAQVEAAIMKMSKSDFAALTVKGETITFFSDPDGKAGKTYTYRAVGSVPDTFGEMAFEWYGFEAVDKANCPYRYIILLSPESHNGGEPHFHIRYGNVSFEALTEPAAVKLWWPTMLQRNFDMDKLIEGMDPAEFATLM